MLPTRMAGSSKRAVVIVSVIELGRSGKCATIRPGNVSAVKVLQGKNVILVLLDFITIQSVRDAVVILEDR